MNVEYAMDQVLIGKEENVIAKDKSLIVSVSVVQESVKTLVVFVTDKEYVLI